MNCQGLLKIPENLLKLTAMPPILSWYIFKETLQTYAVVTGVLLMILVTNSFAQVLGDAAGDKLPKEVVFQVMGLTSVQYLIILIPISLFLAIMLTLARLYRDSEMDAILSAGIGSVSLYKPLFGLAFVLAVLAGWLSLVVAPEAIAQVEAIAQSTKYRANLSLVEPGRFMNIGSGDTVLYAESVSESGRLKNVFVQRRIGAQLEVVVAEEAMQSDSSDGNIKVLRFFRGRRYEGVAGSPEFRIVEFDEHGIPFVVPEEGPAELLPETQPLSVLINSTGPDARAELQWRLSFPLAVLVLTILAVPLSRGRPRQSRYSGLAAGVLIYIMYANLLGVAKVWVEKEQVSPVIGMWWVHGLFLAVGILMLLQQYGVLRRIFPRRSVVEYS